jgi:antitoxin VapB
MPDLNIKNPEAYRLARELSDATGESMTRAVIESVRERLQRLRSERDVEVEERIRRIHELATFIRDAAPPGYWDYDDDGLPR